MASCVDRVPDEATSVATASTRRSCDVARVLEILKRRSRSDLRYDRQRYMALFTIRNLHLMHSLTDAWCVT